MPSWVHLYPGTSEEFVRLRELAVRIREHPDLSADLACPEPGLLFLSIRTKAGEAVELHCVAPTRDKPVPTFGIFFLGRTADDEHYAHSPDETISILLA